MNCWIMVDQKVEIGKGFYFATAIPVTDWEYLEMDNGFSLALGVVDFFNPILMMAFFLLTVKRVKNEMPKSYWIAYIIGYISVLIAGFMIPAYKCYIGLTGLKFELPVRLVTIINIGFMIAGISIFFGTLKHRKNAAYSIVSPVSLFNSVIVSLGAVGLILVYVSYIKIALRRKKISSIVCIAYSLAVTFSLAFVGAALDETKAVIHWIEEIVNISGMLSLCIGGILLYRDNKNCVFPENGDR